MVLQARIDAGESLNSIAEQSGLFTSQLSRFVRGQAGLSTASLDKLLPVLGLEIKSKKRAAKKKKRRKP